VQRFANRGWAPAWVVLLFGAFMPPVSALAAAKLTVADLEVAQDHTRVVVESPQRIRFNVLSLRNPNRLVLDLQGVELNSVASALAGKLPPDHPYLARVRVTRPRRDVVRVQFDLKVQVEPRVSSVRLGNKRGYRLLLAIYPESGPALARPSRTPSPATGPEEPFQEAFLEVRINDQKPEMLMVLRRKGGGLLVRAGDLRRWRMLAPKGPPLVHRGEQFYPLEAFAGLSYRVDEAAQAVLVTAPPALMMPTALSGTTRRFRVPPPAPTGAFANYDVFVAHSQHTTTPNGLFELGAFGGLGVGVSSFLAKRLPENSRLLRVESTYTHDRPAELDSIRAGDSIGRPGAWGRAVRFGGLHLTTNFATQPGFITFPMPGAAGEAVIPSTIDVYVNDALRLRRDVPTGPFTIQDLPVVTGRGDARLVVRDLLGREQVIIVPYYSTPRLLRRDLQDYSYEVGAVRENFGLASGDYGRGFVAGTHRRGFTDALTAEARGELLRDQQTLGFGAAALVADFVLLNGALAGSHSERGRGGLASIGLERQTRRYGFSASTQVASEHFAQLGLQAEELAPRQINQMFAGISAGGAHSLGVGFARQAYRDRPDTKLATITYGSSLGAFAFLTVSLQRIYAPLAETSLNVFVTVPLESFTTASLSATARRGSETQSLLQVQRSLPPGPGYGYRALTSLSGDERREAGVAYQNNVGTYTLEAGELNGISAVRGSVAGGLSYLGGGLHASRRITDGFGLVQVPGYPGVRVYADNQEVGQTGADGSALVPRLRSYQRNDVRIEEADLPFDAQIQSVQREAVPYFRSGVLLPFVVKPARGAVLTLRLEDGEPVPAGATARIDGDTEEFAVGMRGELYLAGLRANNRVRVTWDGQGCEFLLAFEPGNDPLPDLGTFTCSRSRR
jgi:outer membrane usher protein